VTSQIKDFNSKIDSTPAFFWMITEGNDRKTQVSAGRAYVRAQLAATLHGLSMQPISQALQEYPEVAKPYAEMGLRHESGFSLCASLPEVFETIREHDASKGDD
jgi:hypothetical protein